MTFDPRPEAYPHTIDFSLYDFQESYIEETYQAIIQGYDLFTEKSRDMGATWCVLAVILWCWLYMEGFQALLGSRKEEYVDNWQYKSLFGKLEFFLQTIKDKTLLPRYKRTYMKLVNLDNGNAIEGESANPNFSRAGRYRVILYDEFGFWPDAKRSWTAGGDATTCRLAITTPPDEPSYAKTVRFGGKIKVVTLHWSLHPHKDQAWYKGEQGRRTKEEMLHEIDISWEFSGVGRPYPEADTLVFGSYPYDPKLPLYTSIDLGLDTVALGYYQPVPNTDWMTMVDAYEESDKRIEWYYPFFGLPINPEEGFIYSDADLEFIEMRRWWKRAVLFGDPSGKSRHIESRESPYGKMKAKGLYVQSNDKENDFKSRLTATKTLLPHLRINDTPRTRWAVTCWQSAKYPKRPPESQSTNEITKPVHDWTSHHRTELEFFSVNYKNFPVMPEQVQATRPRRFDSTGRYIS